VVGPSKQANKQASKQANIHTHECNEVTLVWGSLRLAPIICGFMHVHYIHTWRLHTLIIGLAHRLVYA